jgi:hypothetical protein
LLWRLPLYALARFHLVAVGTLGGAFSSTLLVAFGLLSLVVALPFIVAQGDLKRLLAYSSIEHLGLGALALGFGGPVALGGLVLHLFAHGLTKASLFVSAGALVEVGRSRRIARLSGSLAAAPADGRALLGGALLLSGLPPSALFVSEVAIVFGGFAVAGASLPRWCGAPGPDRGRVPVPHRSQELRGPRRATAPDALAGRCARWPSPHHCSRSRSWGSGRRRHSPPPSPGSWRSLGASVADGPAEAAEAIDVEAGVDLRQVHPADLYERSAVHRAGCGLRHAGRARRAIGRRWARRRGRPPVPGDPCACVPTCPSTIRPT